MRRTFISAAAVLAFTAAGHADELSDIQAKAKQLREQNQTMTKRLADLEKRQRALETRPAALNANPVDAMAADLPYKAAVKARPPESDDMCWHGICLYGNVDMGLNYQNHGAPLSPMAVGPLDYAGVEELQRFLFRRRSEPAQHVVHRPEGQAGGRGQSVRRVQPADTIRPRERDGCQRCRVSFPEQRIGAHPAERLQRFFQGRPDVQRRGLFRYQFADLRHADHGPAERAELGPRHQL